MVRLCDPFCGDANAEFGPQWFWSGWRSHSGFGTQGLQKASTNGVSLFEFELMDSEVVAEVDGCAKDTVVIGEGFGAEENAGSGVGATAVLEAGVEGISNGVLTGIVVSVGHDIESAGWLIIGAVVPKDAV